MATFINGVKQGDGGGVLTEDILGEASSAKTSNGAGGYICDVTSINATAEITIDTLTQAYDANSLAVGVAWGNFRIIADTTKIRLYMDGVMVAESAFIPNAGTNIVVMGTKAMSGLVACSIRAYNYDTSAHILLIGGISSGGEAACGIAVGSVKA